MRCKVCDYRLWNLPARRCPECGTEFRPSEFEFVPNSVRFCCPHCNQAYYGTGPNGHLVPFEYDCVSCGRRINMDETVVLPAEGVKEEQTNVGEFPWIERHKLGFFRAWFRTIGKSMIAPMALMRSLPREPEVPTGWWFAFLTLLASLILGALIPCGLSFVFGIAAGGMRGAGAGILLAFFAYFGITVVGIVAILIIWPLVTHLVLRLLNGCNDPFRRTAQAICFSSGAAVCLAIPCLGVYGVGWLWWIVSAILMVKEGQRTSGGKATAAVLAAPVLSVLVLVGVYSLLVYKAITSATAVPTSAPAAVYAETAAMSKALRSFAAVHGGHGPAHAVELATRNYLNYSEFCVMNHTTMESDVPVGDTTLEKIGQLTPQEQAAAVSKAVASLPPGTIAYRFGDFIFTYPGINLNKANPKLWLFVQMPEDVGTSQFQITVLDMAFADGTTRMDFSSDFQRVLKEQNAVRARYGLPPLPDLRKIKHDKPAVVPGWTPASWPASDAESPEPSESAPADDERVEPEGLPTPVPQSASTSIRADPKTRVGPASSRSEFRAWGSAPSQSGAWIRVNQIGYLPSDPKIAILSSDEPQSGTFTVGGFMAPIGRDCGAWGPFRHNYRLNFTEARRPGTYRVIAGDIVSPPFTIGDDAYKDVPDKLLSFMRLQRCGDNPVTGTKCHQQDGIDTVTGQQVNLVGGWHDAADRLKHMITTTYCTGALFLAGADDEARHGAAMVRKIHPDANTVYVQIGDDRDHLPPEGLWQDDRSDYGWGAGGPRAAWPATGEPQGPKYKNRSTGLANLAGRAAAAMALAGDVGAAQSLYAFGRSHPGAAMAVPVRTPYYYAERDYFDDLEWAAAELYIATHDRAYLEQGMGYARQAGPSPWMGKLHHEHYESFPYVNLAHWRLYADADGEAKKELAGFYRTGLDRVRERASQNPYRMGTPMVWCSTNDVVAVATQAVLYEKMTGDVQFRELAAEARDWIFGRNPWGVSFVIDVPADGTAASHPHHLFHKLAEILPVGGLVDGPVSPEINAKFNFPDMGPDPLARFQSSVAVYHDCYADFSTNEPTIDTTTSLLLLLKLW